MEPAAAVTIVRKALGAGMTPEEVGQLVGAPEYQVRGWATEGATPSVVMIAAIEKNLAPLVPNRAPPVPPQYRSAEALAAARAKGFQRGSFPLKPGTRLAREKALREIQYVAKYSGLTHAAIAKRCGFKSDGISHLVSGQHAPRSTFHAAIEALYNEVKAARANRPEPAPDVPAEPKATPAARVVETKTPPTRLPSRRPNVAATPSQEIRIRVPEGATVVLVGSPREVIVEHPLVGEVNATLPLSHRFA